jgi:hypothetical protein
MAQIEANLNWSFGRGKLDYRVQICGKASLGII